MQCDDIRTELLDLVITEDSKISLNMVRASRSFALPPPKKNTAWCANLFCIAVLRLSSSSSAIPGIPLQGLSRHQIWKPWSRGLQYDEQASKFIRISQKAGCWWLSPAVPVTWQTSFPGLIDKVLIELTTLSLTWICACHATPNYLSETPFNSQWCTDSTIREGGSD